VQNGQRRKKYEDQGYSKIFKMVRIYILKGIFAAAPFCDRRGAQQNCFLGERSFQYRQRAAVDGKI